MRKLWERSEGPAPRITIRIPAPLLDALNELADDQRRQLADVIRLALVDAVEAGRRNRKGRKGRA